MNILIIGGGNMGLTYAKAFINSHIVTTDQLMILEKQSEKIPQLKSLNLGTIQTAPEKCIKKADLIILAVKPQDCKLLFKHIKKYSEKSQVYLSIMAGIKIKQICDALEVTKGNSGNAQFTGTNQNGHDSFYFD